MMLLTAILFLSIILDCAVNLSRAQEAPFMLKQSSPPPLEEGSDVKLNCGADLTKIPRSKVREVQWWKYKDDGHPERISEDNRSRIRISTVEDRNQYNKILSIQGIEKADDRDYLCSVITDSAANPNYLRLNVIPRGDGSRGRPGRQDNYEREQSAPVTERDNYRDRSVRPSRDDNNNYRDRSSSPSRERNYADRSASPARGNDNYRDRSASPARGGDNYGDRPAARESNNYRGQQGSPAREAGNRGAQVSRPAGATHNEETDDADDYDGDNEDYDVSQYL